MNTRLQVEHPVTELITGLDLVEWQLRIASGEELPLTQEEVTLTGHAVEVRLYAEDPRNNFMPQTGTVRLWHYPTRAGLRVDHGIHPGQEVSPFYDPMLAKIIAFGESRPKAIRRLASAVQDTQLLGINNNKLFLQNVLRNEVFERGDATTAFIEQFLISDVSMDQKAPSSATLAHAALLLLHHGVDIKRDRTADWHNPAAAATSYRLAFDGDIQTVSITDGDGHFEIVTGAERFILNLVSIDESECVYVENRVRETMRFAIAGNILYLDDGTGHFILEDVTYQPAKTAGGAGNGQVKAAMDGAIVDVLVREGDTVEAGQTLVVLEAMKMEHALKAGFSGTVTAVSCEVGQQVKSRQLLATVEAG